MANHASLGGHCTVGDNVMIGAHAGVHQYCRIGSGAIVGGLAAVVRDVIPYGEAYGDRARLRGINHEGLKRMGVDRQERRKLHAAFTAIFGNGGSISENAAAVRAEFPENSIGREIAEFVLDDSKRSLCAYGKD